MPIDRKYLIYNSSKNLLLFGVFCYLATTIYFVVGFDRIVIEVEFIAIMYSLSLDICSENRNDFLFEE